MTITLEECFSVILNLSKRQNLLKMKTRIFKSEVNQNRTMKKKKKQEKRMKKGGCYLCMLYIPSVFLRKCVCSFVCFSLKKTIMKIMKWKKI